MMGAGGGARRGVVWGALAGLVVGLMIMWVGLGWTIFLAVVIGLGALVGGRLDSDEWRAQWEELGQRLERWWSERGR